MKTYQSFSSAETKKIGRQLAKDILRRGPKGHGATVLALNGDLGAGKTTFVQGFMLGLGLKTRAVSPTFILMRRHKLSRGGFENVYHADFYRLHSVKELAALDFAKISGEPGNILLIEWAEKIKKALPRGTTRILFSHCAEENDRKIKISRQR